MFNQKEARSHNGKRTISSTNDIGETGYSQENKIGLNLLHTQ